MSIRKLVVSATSLLLEFMLRFTLIVAILLLMMGAFRQPEMLFDLCRDKDSRMPGDCERLVVDVEVVRRNDRVIPRTNVSYPIDLIISHEGGIT